MLVSKKTSFDAAHHLPNYDGKCRNPHGHRWVVELGVSGKVDSETGMVVDFSWLKKVLKEEVTDKFDHSNLNDFYPNPTAETIARDLFESILNNWVQGPEEPLRMEYIRIWEGPESMVEYSWKDWVDEKG